MPSALNPAADSSPLYLQLAHQLEQDIRAGTYRVDQALPSERVLSESLGVSRITARKAIEVLVGQGLVLCRQGSGNFIAPRLEQPLSKLASFSEELRQRGYIPSSNWITREVATASVAEREALGLARGARVARLERLRLADGVPMAYERSTVLLSACPRPQDLDGSLYLHLARSGLGPVRAVQHIRAVNAEPAMAVPLGIAIGAALLWVSRTAYLPEGVAVEHTQSYCRSAYYDFVAELKT
nr:GntR family transcriptional regulator [uncultured Rhodoferax sp.]